MAKLDLDAVLATIAELQRELAQQTLLRRIAELHNIDLVKEIADLTEQLKTRTP